MQRFVLYAGCLVLGVLTVATQDGVAGRVVGVWVAAAGAWWLYLLWKRAT